MEEVASVLLNSGATCGDELGYGSYMEQWSATNKVLLLYHPC